jgi:hypothetical protein
VCLCDKCQCVCVYSLYTHYSPTLHTSHYTHYTHTHTTLPRLATWASTSEWYARTKRHSGTSRGKCVCVCVCVCVCASCSCVCVCNVRVCVMFLVRSLHRSYSTLETRKDGVRFTNMAMKATAREYKQILGEYTALSKDIIEKVSEWCVVCCECVRTCI